MARQGKGCYQQAADSNESAVLVETPAGRGKARPGLAWRGMARPGKVRPGGAWPGMARAVISRFKTRRVLFRVATPAGYGEAWQGLARLGEARQGTVSFFIETEP
jgi:hypothetical protein